MAAAIKLQRHIGRRRAARFLAEGPNLVEAALRRGLVSEVFATEAALDRFAALLVDAPVQVVTERAAKALSDTVTPVGLVAVCVLVFGWGRFVHETLLVPDPVTGGPLLAPFAELAVPLPYFAILFGAWLIYYDAERALHCTTVLGPSDRPFWTRAGYFFYHLRQFALLVLLKRSLEEHGGLSWLAADGVAFAPGALPDSSESAAPQAEAAGEGESSNAASAPPRDETEDRAEPGTERSLAASSAGANPAPAEQVETADDERKS